MAAECSSGSRVPWEVCPMATEQQIQEMNQRLMQLGQMLQEAQDREAALETRLQGVEMAGQSMDPQSKL